MVDNNQPLVPMREFAHIGAEVRDLDKAVDFFSKVFGWGPWERQEADRQALLRGKPVKYKALRAWLRTGPVTLEFGATPGESFQHEFLEATGGGLQHISFDVDDVDEVVAKLDKLGIPVLQAGKQATLPAQRRIP